MTPQDHSNDSNEIADRPLAGVVVVDLTQVYQGPYATFLMAKAGAQVIKIEPIHGEPTRLRAKVSGGASLPMAMLNVNKKGITLNLKTEQGKALFKELVRHADVVVENFAPGVMDRLGIGWDVLHEINPRLIYGTGTGFGITGPDKGNLAMDVTIQASSGIMSVTGTPDGPPLRSGASVVDFLSGVHLYAGIVTALFERTRTGKGRLVEVSMQETAYPTLASNLGLVYRQQGKPSGRVGNRHGGLALAPYNVYEAADGHIAVVCATEHHWQNILKAMGREDLKDDPLLSTNKARVENIQNTDDFVESWTRTLSRDKLFALSKAFSIPAAPVRTLDEVMSDPHMHERGALEWFDDRDLGRIVLPTTPIRIHGAEQVPTVSSPLLGEHNQEIYGKWLGLSDEKLQSLREQEVI
ncbi:CaiB/BaiF CoA transferase family protein [Orrella marina]|uniref:CoA transferase n=1 Tax=Orrella marina TaxID=2163011 RepID=A0A2R4XH83_9BURK|nr:CoA transferase [Orrella marina]AWB33188.1 CoA transferase [Orrella marina]